MLSQTTEYALRAIVFLADHHGEPHTTEAIAEVTKVPSGYLAKILQGLAKNGLVASQRGLHGGFTLLRSPSDLTILDVVQAIDPINRIRSCPLDLPGHDEGLCPLHSRLDSALMAVETAFRRTTIAQMLSDPSSGNPKPLCPFPNSPAKQALSRAKAIRRRP